MNIYGTGAGSTINTGTYYGDITGAGSGSLTIGGGDSWWLNPYPIEQFKINPLPMPTYKIPMTATLDDINPLKKEIADLKAENAKMKILMNQLMDSMKERNV